MPERLQNPRLEVSYRGTILANLLRHNAFCHSSLGGHPVSNVAVRLPENSAGRHYVTSACNGCGVCFSYALQNFMYSNDASYYYVFQQPADAHEEDDVRRAMEVCPMNCIKDDGELL